MSSIEVSSFASHKTPRLPTVLFEQLHIGDGHAPVDGFAHVVNGEQGDIHGGDFINKINNLAHINQFRLSLSCVVCWTKFGHYSLPNVSVSIFMISLSVGLIQEFQSDV